MKHTLDTRVYYENTDAGGIVYHAEYLNFAERGRTELLRQAGYQCSTLHNDVGVMFVVRQIQIDYLAPAQLDQQLQVQSFVEDIKNTSFIMRQRVLRDDNMLADMRVVLVCVDTTSLKPTRLPEKVKEAFQSYLETVE